MWKTIVSVLSSLMRLVTEVLRSFEAKRNIELGERRASDKAHDEAASLRRRLDDADRMLDDKNKRT